MTSALVWLFLFSGPAPAWSAPTVAITAPADGTTYTAYQTITISAAATDSLGISKVEFYRGTSLWCIDITAPYTCSWSTNTANGTYAWTAKAYNAAGATTTSTPVNLSVSIPPPTVSITAPADGTTYTALQTVAISATATTPIGSIGSVAFYDGSALQCTDFVSPYTCSWTMAGTNNGTHVWTAKASTLNGAVTTSRPVNLTVSLPLPTVSISSPPDGTSYAALQTATISATTPDNIGVSRVEFYRGPSLGCIDYTAPYTCSWAITTSTPNGAYVWTAKAYNPTGTATSPALTLTVQIPPPTVSITSPADNTSYNSLQTVTLTASATDSISPVTKVAFYDGSALQCSDGLSPYTCSWSITIGTDPGIHTWTAKASTLNGAVTTSRPVNLIFSPPVPAVVTRSPSSIGSFSAVLSGAADPNEFATIGWFRYSATDPGSCNDAFGTRVPASGGALLGSTQSGVTPNYTQNTGMVLAPSTTYYYCAIAADSFVTGFGRVVSFTTRTAKVSDDYLHELLYEADTSLMIKKAQEAGLVVDSYIGDESEVYVIKDPVTGEVLLTDRIVSAQTEAAKPGFEVPFLYRHGPNRGIWTCEAKAGANVYIAGGEFNGIQSPFNTVKVVNKPNNFNESRNLTFFAQIEKAVIDSVLSINNQLDNFKGGDTSKLPRFAAVPSSLPGRESVEVRFVGDLGGPAMMTSYRRTRDGAEHTTIYVAENTILRSFDWWRANKIFHNPNMVLTNLMTHELWHAMGAAHVSREADLMYPSVPDLLTLTPISEVQIEALIAAHDPSPSWVIKKCKYGFDFFDPYIRLPDFSSYSRKSGHAFVHECQSTRGSVLEGEEVWVSCDWPYNTNVVKLKWGWCDSPPCPLLPPNEDINIYRPFAPNLSFFFGHQWHNTREYCSDPPIDFSTSLRPVLPAVTDVSIIPDGSGLVSADGSSQYKITVAASDPSGSDNIDRAQAVINRQGGNAGSYGGYIAWSRETGPYDGSGKDVRACSGGGYAAINPDPRYNPSYVSLDSCTVLDSGNTRRVHFNVRFHSSFTTPGVNTISGSAFNDLGGLGWQTGFARSGFTLNNVDTTAPTVAITQPLHGATVSGIVTISAQASDNVGVSGVQFQVDGKDLGAAVPAAPYTIRWDTTQVANGAYILWATATDSSSNTATSSLVMVTVSNPPTLALSASPASLTEGSSATLTWASTNASSCTASGAWTGQTTVTSGTRVVTPAATSTYTLSCTGSGGTVTQSTTVSVVALIKHVQSAATTNSKAGTSLSKAFASATTAGNLIIAAVTFNTSQGTAWSCSDRLGNTYVQASFVNDTRYSQGFGICYAANVKAGSTNTVTVAYGGKSPTKRSMAIHEYSGVVTASALDKTSTNIGTSAAATSNAVTPAMGGELIFGTVGVVNGTTPTITAGSGFTKRQSVTGLTSQDRVHPTAAPIASTFTFSASQAYGAQVATFRPKPKVATGVIIPPPSICPATGCAPLTP